MGCAGICAHAEPAASAATSAHAARGDGTRRTRAKLYVRLADPSTVPASFPLTAAVPARYQLGVRFLRLGLGGALAVVALTCAAEAALRFAAPRPVRAFLDVPLDGTTCVPDREYALRPSTTIEYAGVRTTLNAWGLRGPLPSAGTQTAVVAVGDELTFGWGVADAE